MLWEHKLLGNQVFPHFLEISQTFRSVSIKQLDYKLKISIANRNQEQILFSVNLAVLQNFI